MDDLFANLPPPPPARAPVPAELPPDTLYFSSHYEWSKQAAPWYGARMLDGGAAAVDSLWWRVANPRCHALRMAIWMWLLDQEGAREVRRDIFQRLDVFDKDHLRQKGLNR